MFLQRLLNVSFVVSIMSVTTIGSLVIHAKIKYMARESISYEWNQIKVEVPDTAQSGVRKV